MWVRTNQTLSEIKVVNTTSYITTRAGPRYAQDVVY